MTEEAAMTEIPVGEDVRDYIDAIPAAHRPLFDRLHGLIVRARPDVTVVMSYKMPTYKAGGRRVLLAAWKHGISVYGWRKDDDGGFVERHPKLKTSTGTIQLRPDDAAAIGDEEFLGLFRGALAG
jgi:Domain of unknown function (DU1801)